jgi:hypothetical protein
MRSRGGRPLATIKPWRRSNLAKRRVAITLAASGHRVVFRAGRSIYVIDARSGRLHLVARAAGNPTGLSIVGRRIAWAENVGRGARVRAVTP